MPHIVVLGSTNIDLTFRTARLPRPGETVPGKAVFTGFGGKGSNQAVLAARLGATVSMISAVGDDDFGRQALDNYRRSGVDVAHVRTAPGPTGTACILTDDAANNCIVVVPGANAAVSAADVHAARDVITSADVVVAQLETPTEATLAAFRLARSAGVRTLLNPAPALPVDDLLPLTDLCIPNETELETLTGQSAADLAQAERAARGLLRHGGTVLVTLGPHGALLVTPGRARHIPSRAVKAVDPTAAGDAFIGSLAVFLADGVELAEAARRACSVAALTVTRAGAQLSFPSRQEIEAWLGSPPA